jgi:hypothetical protein
MTKAILPLLLAAGALLAGCGKVGYLDQPAPMWDQKAKADYKARKAAGQPIPANIPTAPPGSLMPAQPGSATPVPAAAAPPPSPATASTDSPR